MWDCCKAGVFINHPADVFINRSAAGAGFEPALSRLTAARITWLCYPAVVTKARPPPWSLPYLVAPREPEESSLLYGNFTRNFWGSRAQWRARPRSPRCLVRHATATCVPGHLPGGGGDPRVLIGRCGSRTHAYHSSRLETTTHRILGPMSSCQFEFSRGPRRRRSPRSTPLSCRCRRCRRWTPEVCGARPRTPRFSRGSPGSLAGSRRCPSSGSNESNR